jgi:salicylate hydroxylase
MFPFYAQGAVQAIEDAAALAVCLDVKRREPGRALDIYQNLRMPRAGKIQNLSHARKDINHLPDGPEQVQRDADLASTDALARSGWIYGYDAETAAWEACSAD